jgi:hypothetical protein
MRECVNRVRGCHPERSEWVPDLEAQRAGILHKFRMTDQSLPYLDSDLVLEGRARGVRCSQANRIVMCKEFLRWPMNYSK